MAAIVQMEEAFKNAHPFFQSIDLRIQLLETLLRPTYVRAEVGANHKYLVACMCVCQAWYEIGKSLLWRHIERPEKSLGSVLHQFSRSYPVDLSEYDLTHKDRFMRMSAKGFERYRHYAQYIQSIDNYVINEERDEAFCSVLSLLSIRGKVFPKLKRVAFILEQDTPAAFPPLFRTKEITEVLFRRREIEGMLVPIPLVLPMIIETAKYCPHLEQLTVESEVGISRIEDLFGSSHYLHALSLQIQGSELDRFMTFVLQRADMMTSIGLNIMGDRFSPQRYRSRSFPNLRQLSIQSGQPSECIIGLLKGFPSVKKLEVLNIRIMLGIIENYSRIITSLYAAVEEFWCRSQFSHLKLYVNTFFSSTDEFDISPLLQIKSLKSLDISVAGVQFLKVNHVLAIPESWKKLQSLSLIFSDRSYVETTVKHYISLQDILYITSHLPNLTDLTASMDLRRSSNPALWEGTITAYDDDGKSEGDSETSLISPNLRCLEVHSLFSEYNPDFVAQVFREMIPNLDIAILRLDGQYDLPTWRRTMERLGFQSDKAEIYLRPRN